MKTNYALLILIGFVLTLSGCSPKTGKNIEQTSDIIEESITEDVEEAIDIVEDGVEEVAAEVVEAVNSINNSISKIPVDDQVLIGDLPNGMKYYIQKNLKPENRAELRLIVNAGSMQEDDDQLGVAHFVEHMAFNGSTNFKKNELVDYLESTGMRFGPDLNAYTSFDETVYMLQVRTDSMEIFDKGLLVLSDWATGITFEDEEIDKERGVVTSEWRTRLSGEQRMQQNYFPIMYHGSRYAKRLPIGDPDIINNADYETIKRFYQDWYRTDLMAVAVVGDIDVEETEAKIKEIFSVIPPSEEKRAKQSNEVPDHEETFISINSDKEAAFTNVTVMYKHDHIEVETENDYRALLVRQLYNRMLNNRLNELRQLADPPFIYAYSGYGGDVGDLDTYTSYAGAPEGKSAKAMKVLLVENERALRYGFAETELERQKVGMMESINRRVKEKDKIESRSLARRYVRHFLDDTAIPSIDQQLEYYEKFLPTITVDEVNNLAKDWITPENRVIVITAPEKEDVPLPTEDELMNIVETIPNLDIEPYEDKVIDVPLFDKELESVEIVSEVTYEEVAVTEIELENGAKVVLKPTDFKNDEVLMSASSEGGSSLYSDAEYFTASNAAKIVNESGLGDFSNTDLQKLLTGKTVNVSPYIGSYSEGLSGFCAPKDMETMFQMIHMYFTDVRKDEASFQSFVSKQSNIYKNLMSNPNYFFMDYASKKKTQNHPRMGFPTVEKLEELDLDRAYEIYNERFADASGFTFIFVGNFEEEAIRALSQKYLGTLPSKKEEETFKNLGINYLEGEIRDEFNMGEAPKTQVELYFHGPLEWTPENAYNFNSMLDVLRIKLRESMREDKGGVYGVKVYGSASRVPEERYSITISFNCDPENMEDLIETALKDVENAKANGAESKDIDKVKETQRQSTIKNLKENFYWQSRLQYMYENNMDPTLISIDQLEKSMESLNGEAVKSASQQYFGSGNFLQIIMQPASTPSN